MFSGAPIPLANTVQAVALNPASSIAGEALHLRALGCNIAIHCQASPDVCRALDIAFGGMRAPPAPGRANLEYAVRQTDSGILLEADSTNIPAEDIGDLLYLLDKSITLALQRIRTDLCFLHSGAVTGPDGRVIVLTAASGSGKSTLTWALLHHGFGYLSDELAPIDPRTLVVQGYRHALCLKRKPPESYRLPSATLETTRTLHVPVAGTSDQGSVAAILFVSHRYPENHPVLTDMSPARAAIHLYSNTLNPLAHPNDGLDAIAGIVQHVPSYELNSANLGAACAAIQALFKNLR